MAWQGDSLDRRHRLIAIVFSCAPATAAFSNAPVASAFGSREGKFTVTAIVSFQTLASILGCSASSKVVLIPALATFRFDF